MIFAQAVKGGDTAPLFLFDFGRLLFRLAALRNIKKLEIQFWLSTPEARYLPLLFSYLS